MSRSSFSGPVASAAGFEVAGQASGPSVASDTLTAAGAINVNSAETTLALTGAGAVTLAVPTTRHLTKVIHMSVDNGDVTMALTNVIIPGSTPTTATFNDANDYLVLQSSVSRGKWIIVANGGVTLA